MRRQANIVLFLIGIVAPSALQAEKIKNDVAVFAALDKVTAQISPLEIPIDKTATFGPLKITPRVCNTRPPTEQPITSAFVEIDEDQADESEKRVFTGWMFAESPGLHALEHPIFDVWLTSCKTVAAEASPGNSWKPQ